MKAPLSVYRSYSLIVALVLINIGVYAQDKVKTIHVGFVYPISNHGSAAKEYSNAFSLHALAGVSREERGFAMSGLANFVADDAKSFTIAGFGNFIGKDANGSTIAGFINKYHGGSGLQAAGFLNLAKESVSGLQLSGFLNTAGKIHGAQVSGYVNLAKDSVNGIQYTGFLNTAGNVNGAQISGFMNKAKEVTGAQVGFLNIADHNDYPIGVVNIIKDGEKAIGVTTDDNQTTLLTFRSGSKKLYGIVGAGANLTNKTEVLAVQVGLGAHFFTRQYFRLNTELTHTILENYKKVKAADRGDFSKYSLSILPALRFSRFEIFGGPSLNVLITDSTEGRKLVDHYLWDDTTSSGKVTGLYIGYVAGVHVRL